jgi:hypothetical protein
MDKLTSRKACRKALQVHFKKYSTRLFYTRDSLKRTALMSLHVFWCRTVYYVYSINLTTFAA